MGNRLRQWQSWHQVIYRLAPMITGLYYIMLCCATNRKVTGSIPAGVIGFFIDIKPSDRTMTLGSTQPLTEMNISWGKGGRC